MSSDAIGPPAPGDRRPPAGLALVALLAGASAIGLAPVLVRLSELGPTATAFWRVALAVPLLALFAALRGSALRAPLRAARGGLILVGLLFAADLALWHQSIRFTSVANATLLANLAPILVAAAMWALFGERPGWRLSAGLLLATAGAAAMLGESARLSPEALLGDLLGVGTAGFYAAYLIGVSRLRRRLPTVALMTASSAVTALGLVPVVGLAGEGWLPASAGGWLTLLLLAGVSHVLGQGLIAWAMATLPASFSALALLWQPVAAAALGALILGEGLRPGTILGGLLVLAAIAIAYRPARRGGAGSPP